jgi:hypothetical protein
LSFKDIAQPLIERGVPVFPLAPRTKIPVDKSMSEWPILATTDSAQILRWDSAYPNANCAAVAKAEPNGIWILDIDSPAAARILSLPHLPKTFQVRSSPSKGHTYFRHNAASLALAGKKAYYSIKNPEGKEIVSARLNNAYVVGAGSIHPVTLEPYEVIRNVPLVEAPQELLDWIAQHAESDKIPVTANLEGPKIPRGSHDNELTRIAGKLRQAGMEPETMAVALIEICEKRCEDYGPDYQEMCQKIAHSIGKKPIVDNRVYHNGVPVDFMSQQTQAAPVVVDPNAVPVNIDDSGVIDYPKFPESVMWGTSLYENLVKPVIASSDKYAELIYMPAVLMLINAIALRVHLKSQAARVPNLFVGVIAPYGHFYKSSSCELAQNFFMRMGMAVKDVQTAGEKTVILSPGSPEGLGLRLKDKHATRAVLYYDELGKFVAKGKIDHSSFLEDICSIYDSRDFANEIKSNKDSYRFSAGTYCFSWLWCTTDRKFPQLWANLANEDSGLNDRMFFLLAPQKEREHGLYSEIAVDTEPTRHLIEAAITKAEFDYEDRIDAQSKVKGIDPRSIAMFENLALYFAIDLGLDCIDRDCCERAKLLVEYRNKTQEYLDPVQAENNQAKDQTLIVRELQKHQGQMATRLLKKALHVNELGTRRWNDAYRGLLDEGVIAHREGVGASAGRKPEEQRPAMTYLLKQEE